MNLLTLKACIPFLIVGIRPQWLAFQSLTSHWFSFIRTNWLTLLLVRVWKQRVTKAYFSWFSRLSSAVARKINNELLCFHISFPHISDHTKGEMLLSFPWCEVLSLYITRYNIVPVIHVVSLARAFFFTFLLRKMCLSQSSERMYSILRSFLPFNILFIFTFSLFFSQWLYHRRIYISQSHEEMHSILSWFLDIQYFTLLLADFAFLCEC